VNEYRSFPGIKLDRELCQGTGYCEQLAPSLFKLDEEGLSTLAGAITSVAELEVATQAEDICPTRAIILRLAANEDQTRD
jgi:ferredoxin